MGDCLSKLTQNIVSNCETQGVGGIEPDYAWVLDRSDASFTYDVTNPSMITAITMSVGTRAWKIQAVKKGLNSGHDGVVAENRATRYTHKWDFEAFELETEAREQIDSMEDVVVIYERKDKTATGDGTFIIRGAKYGLWKTSDAQDENTVQGARPLNFASMAGMEEPYSAYTFLVTNYADTKAALVVLETPAP
jgi:hypothetical protein